MKIKEPKTVVKKSNHKMSSGKRPQRRLNAAVRKTKMKIARWERNQANPEKKKAGKFRKGWNTDGLKKHLEMLEASLLRK